ncbi:MAG: DUF72 domain-containing protein [Planctomycetota bacterium]
MKTGAIRIGTSGYTYDHWTGAFYPGDLPQDRWLSHYAKHFETVEINNTFYQLPDPHTFDNWAASAPNGFVYAVKASRYLTHMKKLKDPEEPWSAFWKGARRLGDALGPVLVQLPPHWRCNPDRLDAFLSILPDAARVAVEFRDASWHCDTIYDLLADSRHALCVHDMAEAEAPRRAVGAFAYCRFHGSAGAYKGRYGKQRLRPWARWLRCEAEEEGRDVYAYFNNDQKAYAVQDAFALRELIDP